MNNNFYLTQEIPTMDVLTWTNVVQSFAGSMPSASTPQEASTAGASWTSLAIRSRPVRQNPRRKSTTSAPLSSAVPMLSVTLGSACVPLVSPGTTPTMLPSGVPRSQSAPTTLTAVTMKFAPRRPMEYRDTASTPARGPPAAPTLFA